MSLTPSEILHKEFSSKFRGYAPDEVNDFLDIVVAEFEKLTLSNKEMSSKIVDMQDKLNYFQQLQDSLNNSIVVAQEAAERLKQNARKEAELILYEAEREADRLVEDAVVRSQSIVSETENLRRYGKEFRQKLSAMVQEQLSLINGTEYQELFDNEVSDVPAVEFNAANSVANRLEQLEQQSDEEVYGSREAIELPSEVSVPEIQEDFFEAEDPFVPEATDAPKNGESVLGRTIRIDLPEM